MDTLELFLISIPIGLLITWRLLTGSTHQHRDERRASESLEGGDRYSRKRNVGLAHARFEAKRMHICNQPCNAALKVRDKIYLSGDEPPLPLPDCDRPDGCHCSYTVHDDRRTGRERRYPAEDIVASDQLVLPDSAVLTEDKRTKRDRRSGRKAGNPYAGVS